MYAALRLVNAHGEWFFLFFSLFPFLFHLFFFLAAGCVSRLGSVWERPASSVRAVRAAAFSTRVGVQVSRWVVVTTTRDVVRSRVVRIAEDLNMGGMVGWFGVFTFFCSVR